MFLVVIGMMLIKEAIFRLVSPVEVRVLNRMVWNLAIISAIKNND